MEQRSLDGLSEAYFAGRLQYSSSVDEGDEAFRDLYAGEIARLALRTSFVGFGFMVLATIVHIPTLGLFAWRVLGFGFTSSFRLWAGLMVAVFASVWFIPRHEFAGRWQLTMEGCSDLVESVAMMVVGRLGEKRVPADASVVSKLHRGDRQERFYVLVGRGRYQGYVSVLGFGSDLFVTWSMWRHHRPAAAIWRSMSDALASLSGNRSVLPKHSRNDPERALREVVHDAVRFGIEQAVAGSRKSVAGTFGSDIDLDDNPYQFADQYEPERLAVEDGGYTGLDHRSDPADEFYLPESDPAFESAGGGGGYDAEFYDTDPGDSEHADYRRRDDLGDIRGLDGLDGDPPAGLPPPAPGAHRYLIDDEDDG